MRNRNVDEPVRSYRFAKGKMKSAYKHTSCDKG